jgi:hypothetical protein
MKSNWCKSSLARAVAGGPVASVAIRRVTGGCRSVHSEEAGRECSAPKTLYRCDADAVSLAEGCIRSTDMQGVSGVAGVPSPGHAFKETSRERRRAHDLCRTTGVWFTQIRTNQAVGRNEGVSKQSEPTLNVAVSRRQGRPEAPGTDRRAVLRTHTTDEGGEPQGSGNGRPRYPLEGRGKQVDVSRQ